MASRELSTTEPDTASPDRTARRDLGQVLVALLALLLCIGVWLDGAFEVAEWAPSAMFALGAVIVLGPGARLDWRAQVFAGGLMAFALWTLLSTTWSDSPSTGIESAGRNLFYAALAGAAVACLPRRAAAVEVGRVITGLLVLLSAVTLGLLLVEGKDLILAGRLDTPVGYRNGAAATMAMSAVACICVAAPRGSNPLVRALGFGLAVAALGLAYLAQSRGVVLGFVGGAAMAALIGPDRVRRTWLTLAAVGVVVVVHSALLTPYNAFLDDRFVTEADLDEATTALVVAAAASGVVMLLLALLDRGLRVTPLMLGRIRRASVVVLVVGVVAGGGAALASVGDPVDFADEKVQEFKTLQPTDLGSSRLGSAGGQRYDLWRIALDAFSAAPLVGAGEGSYPVRYYEERRTDRNALFAHSLPIGTLGDNGLIGLALLVATFVAAAAVLVRPWRALSWGQRRTASTLLAAGTVVVLQCAVDWLWSIAALAGLAVLLLAVGARIVTAPQEASAPPGRATASSWRLAGVVAAVVIAALFVSATYLRVGRNQRAEPERALASADTAIRFGPWSLEARYLRAGALESLGRVDAARAELREALDREPTSFVTMALLGDLEVRAGDVAAGRDWYARAARLNPRDVGLAQLARIDG